jgi:(p)ppGpp synthase/HD superfamily hydrolase
VRERFGERVAECVRLLTDAPGESRAERKAATYARLAGVAGASVGELSLVVKAADRLANVRCCVADPNPTQWQVYRQEQAAFRRAAYRAGLCDPLWAEIESLLAAPPFDGKPAAD